MFGKSFEYWAVFLAMLLYVACRDSEEEPVRSRLLKTFISGLLAYGSSDEISSYFPISPTISTVLIMAFGLIALDILTGFLKDREFIKDLIKAKWGGKK